MELVPDDDRVLVTAIAGDLLGSRAYTHDEGDGIVRNGKYWCYYPNSSSNYVLGEVDFDILKNSTAYITNGKEILRSEIQENKSLYLDNVSSSTDIVKYNSTSKLWVFQNNNPFVMGIMDDSNDLLWGESMVKTNTKYIDFDLHHVMAGVRVKITIDNSENLADDIDLSRAEVFITHLIQKPYAYNRIDGAVTLKDEPQKDDYVNLTMVDLIDTDNPKLKWGSVAHDENNDKIEIYTTSNFILPPQSPDSKEWPQLVVRFPNPKPEEADTKPIIEYFGYLPHAMETDYPGGTNYGMNLAFLREHILEIRTKISQNPPQLVFMPVKVYKWINWGPYTLTGNQEGIYDLSDLQFIMEYYNNYSEKMLKRYGELQNGTWSFNLWRNLTAKYSELANKMPLTDGKQNYSFNLHNKYKVTVLDDDGSMMYTLTTGEDLAKLLSTGVGPEMSGT